jgi:transcription elongation factor Elf1
MSENRCWFCPSCAKHERLLFTIGKKGQMSDLSCSHCHARFRDRHESEAMWQKLEGPEIEHEARRS